MGVHNINDKASFEAALKEDGVMVVDFFATWCGPCKVIAPKVVDMSNSHPSIRFYKIDVDELPEVSQEVGITAMPTFVIFKGGEKVETVVGANPVALENAVKIHSS